MEPLLHFGNQPVTPGILVPADHLIGDFVHRVHAARTRIHHNIPVIQMKTMYHSSTPVKS